MLYPTNFEETIENGLHIERALIARWFLKLNSSKDSPSSSNDKPKIWVTNKNITNDGVVDARALWNAQKTLQNKPQVPQTSYVPSGTQNNQITYPKNNQVVKQQMNQGGQ